MTDAADRPVPRFPEARVAAVEARLEARFHDWQVGPQTLLVCGAARGGDLLAARVARRSGGAVFALLAHPIATFRRTSVHGGAEHWHAEFDQLLQYAQHWTLPDGPADESTAARYARTNDWMLAVAIAQANGRPFDLLAIWDGVFGELGGTGDMVTAARRAGARVTVIDPTA